VIGVPFYPAQVLELDHLYGGSFLTTFHKFRFLGGRWYRPAS
jgi:hypothetical protein